jgi:hypothetical protein
MLKIIELELLDIGIMIKMQEFGDMMQKLILP